MDPELENPFVKLSIASHDQLHTVSTRMKCPQCTMSRKYFCYTCHIPMPIIAANLPQIKLPLKVDIIKHRFEVDGKSTAVHARLLAPDHVTIYTYPDMPQYTDKDKILLVYPYKDAVSLEDLVKETSASKVSSKPEHCGQTPIHCECPNGVPLSDTEIHSRLNEQPMAKMSSSCSQDDQDTSVGIKCCSDVALTASKLTASEQSSQHHLSVRHHQTSSLETDSRSEALQTMTSNGSNCPNTVAGDVLGSGLAAESHCCHQNAQRSPSNAHSAVSGFACESHFCHQGDTTDGQRCTTETAKRDFEEEPFNRVIFIDSTWSQSKAISGDGRLSGIKRVIIPDRLTTFWRSQLHKPPTYLATIEAIYYFLIDYNRVVLRNEPGHQYDNLLFLYSFLHSLVHKAMEDSGRTCRNQKDKMELHRLAGKTK